MSTRILIADDEPNILISLEYLMKRAGYEVLLARDGQEALDMMRREHPSLVLLDVMMPLKTGFEVCQELRADDSLRDILVLMLTAKGRDTDIAKGLAMGADAYMTKPFSTQELVQKVRSMLDAPDPPAPGRP
ncbi:MAG: response regulator [Burkholderiaceae bacterium]|jgi:DNA-binding response OmpR family regulator|nr:response regulator [Aquabacterium sp.]NUP84500.1 response regulator [Burkholderiaceae bacterium]